MLGRPAIDALNLVQKVDTNHCEDSRRIEQEVKKIYPCLFKGLGKLEGQWLTPGSARYAIATPRRVALPLMPKVKEELQRMEKPGFISKVDLPTDWCADMVVVPRPYGRISRTPKSSRFWQEKLSPDSRFLTTFITPFGRFCFKPMPFGIKSAPEHYQRKMSQILEESEGYISIIDDMLIHGKTQEEHYCRLKAILKRLDDMGATLNAEKVLIFEEKGQVCWIRSQRRRH